MKWKFCKFFICNKTEPIKNQNDIMTSSIQGNGEMMQTKNDENLPQLDLRRSSLQFFSKNSLRQWRQTSKGNKAKTDDFLIDMYGLREDYSCYLRQAMERDFAITADCVWEEVLAKFSEQKKQIQDTIADLQKKYSDKNDIGYKKVLYELLLCECFTGNYVPVHYLLEAGAPIQLPHVRLEKNLQVKGFYPVECKGSAFHVAAYSGSWAITMMLYKMLKKQKKDDIRLLLTNDNNMTPLHYAALCYNEHDNYLPQELIQFYIDHGCSINNSDKNGMTPLHLVVYNYPFHAFKIQYGFDLPLNTDEISNLENNELFKNKFSNDKLPLTFQIVEQFLRKKAALYTENTKSENRIFPILSSKMINKFNNEKTKSHLNNYYQKIHEYLQLYADREELIAPSDSSRAVLLSTPLAKARI